jgi:ACR3 family arsenite efflux pump ArsB
VADVDVALAGVLVIEDGGRNCNAAFPAVVVVVGEVPVLVVVVGVCAGVCTIVVGVPVVPLVCGLDTGENGVSPELLEDVS